MTSQSTTSTSSSSSQNETKLYSTSSSFATPTTTAYSFDIDAIHSSVQSCFEEAFPEGFPEDEEQFERQKRDFVTRFKALAQKTMSHEELLSLVMSSYDMFVGEIDLRSLEAKKPKVAEEENVHMPYFNVRKEDWIVYLIIAFTSIVGKWIDERYASSFAKKHGMERHVFMKVNIYVAKPKNCLFDTYILLYNIKTGR